MRHDLLRALTAAALALFTPAPAFAACNPGTPNCIRVMPALATLKSQLFAPGAPGSGEQECHNRNLCGIDAGDGTSPGVARGKQTTPSIPIPPPGSIQVR